MAVDLISSGDKKRIEQAIRSAELNTSGELRVHIERRCPEELMDRAAYLFEQLKMHKTAARNGVLFYLALDDRLFAVLGDVGINTQVGADFWEGIKAEMQELFRKGDWTGGLEKGIELAGEQLKDLFPRQQDDENELSDELSFGR
ncbi:TPM domain-containing protein [Geofilum rhodophaeum]|uniref:TPM domain-containing protein n=1 Tax=Geofilum rhodophaeum TaxID=1965019 RepID=UPI000B521233|nr:TPM domain-containing protein [Geofilum rhodophaeum]